MAEAQSNIAAQLPELLRELRYYNETVDYVVFFDDETAAASLATEPEWIDDLVALLEPEAEAGALAETKKQISNLQRAGKKAIKTRSTEGYMPEEAYRELMAKREDLFEAITEASPARAGGLANQVVHEYRAFCEEVIINYFFAPSDTKLSTDHDLARDKLVRWLDELPISLKEKIGVQQIMAADEDLYRTARMRIQERTAGRVPNDATYENLATIRERLLDRLIELQIVVSEHSVTADNPLVIGGRRRLEADLHSEMARYVRHEDQMFTLVICVIDKIKAMHAKLGQEVTDSIVRQVAAGLIETLRPYDKVYTAGGGKLAMLLPNSAASGGFEAARRCQKALLEHRFSLPSGRNIQVTATFGVSESRPGENWQGLYDAAYKALTAAKSRGNNQCCARIDEDLVFDDEKA
ncbi:MAG: diguanylate cyclase [Alphaproteobacteria bacterium]|nr:diguanylate cyclase [Alphaproteobacteria bacterium SS10]